MYCASCGAVSGLEIDSIRETCEIRISDKRVTPPCGTSAYPRCTSPKHQSIMRKAFIHGNKTKFLGILLIIYVYGVIIFNKQLAYQKMYLIDKLINKYCHKEVVLWQNELIGMVPENLKTTKNG